MATNKANSSLYSKVEAVNGVTYKSIFIAGRNSQVFFELWDLLSGRALVKIIFQRFLSASWVSLAATYFADLAGSLEIITR